MTTLLLQTFSVVRPATASGHFLQLKAPTPLNLPLAWLRRQQELETQVKLASILSEPRAVVPAASHNNSTEELERLAKRLRGAEDDAGRLRNALRDQVRLENDKHGHRVILSLSLSLTLSHVVGVIVRAALRHHRPRNECARVLTESHPRTCAAVI